VHEQERGIAALQQQIEALKELVTNTGTKRRVHRKTS